MTPHPHVALPGLANGDPVPSRTAPAAVRERAIEINDESTRAELGADPGPGLGYGASTADPQPARARRPEPGPVPVAFLHRPIYASASWSFKDSWVTNITALGGGVGAIVAAAGATSTVFPGVALDRFAILLAFFAAVVVMGPLVLGLCLPRSDDPDLVQATGFSLLVAAFVTLVGVGGEIGTIGSLIWLSSPAPRRPPGGAPASGRGLRDRGLVRLPDDRGTGRPQRPPRAEPPLLGPQRRQRQRHHALTPPRAWPGRRRRSSDDARKCPGMSVCQTRPLCSNT